MKAIEKIRAVVEDSDSMAGRMFDLVVQVFILISLVGLSLETVPDLDASTLEILKTVDVVCVMIFSVEYMLRIFVAKKKLKFVFSFYGMIDLLSILPFYLSFGIDLRSVRSLRLLRVFRILKLFRFNESIVRFKMAFSDVRNDLAVFGVAALILLYFSSFGIYFFEHNAQPERFGSIFHCLWWSIVTMTTVGYGDVYPVTVGGKIFTSMVMILGIGVVAVPTGLISSSLTKIKKNKKVETEKALSNDVKH